jgi:hypothetical protein
MDSMSLLDITVKYFSVIVFVLCVLFGMISLFASWVAWRELHKKRNLIRGLVAAYNIAEDALDQGRDPMGVYRPDPAVTQTVFNSLLEVLNALYGEVSGKPMPAREDRGHGRDRAKASGIMGRLFRKKKPTDLYEVNTVAPNMPPEDQDRASAAMGR